MATAQEYPSPPDQTPQDQHRLLYRLARVPRQFPWIVPSLDVTHLEVPIADLPPGLDGFTMAQVSDLHAGGGDWWPLRLDEAVEAVRAAAPDLVVNTGDFMQWEPPIEEAAAAAARFVIPSRDDVSGPVNLAVMGNHDHYAGEDAVADLSTALAGKGIRVLTNEMVSVKRGGASVTFAGLSLESPGFEEAVAALGRSEGPRIVLGHAPEIAERLPAGSTDLLLAGHTHGGQITLPFLKPWIIRRFCGSHFEEGWYRINGNRMYINRGLGCTGLPLRFRAAPEVTVVRLVR